MRTGPGSSDDGGVFADEIEALLDAAEGKPPSPADTETSSEPRRIGRFVIREELGRGAMGVVYRGWDEELDRRVAIKVLREAPGADGAVATERMRREAQAMAKLNHVNVAQIYEVGSLERRLYLAIEHIEGVTLTDWARAESRTWREVLAVMGAAGRGLQAAHEVDLVHRDFKPDNVMVANDGRVVVLDFGLARTAPDADPAAPTEPEGGAAFAETVERSLTGAGALVGTPAYMAPELFEGDAAGPKTDQFAFCVALYQMLYGERPFRAQSVAAMMVQTKQGDVRPAPADSAVPVRLRRVALTGLHPDPAQRHPDMRALLAALATDPAARRTRILASLAAIAGLGTLVVYAASTDPAVDAQPCSGAAELLATHWDDERRQAARDGLVGTQVPYAEAMWGRVGPALDAYAKDWVAAHTEACAATTIRGEQSRPDMDLRMACLARGLVQFGALTSAFARADKSTAARAVIAAESLPALSRCAHVESLRGGVAPPSDAEVAAKVEEIRDGLARASALRTAARFDDALELAKILVAEAEGVSYPPVLAEALDLLGTLHEQQGAYEEAEAALTRAYFTATEAGDDERVLVVAIHMLFLAAPGDKDMERGHEWIGHAAAARQRVADPNPVIIADLHTASAAVYLREGRNEDALAEFRQALAIQRQLRAPGHPYLATAMQNVGTALNYLGETDEAVALHREALTIARGAYGPGHPKLADAMGTLANALDTKGEHAEAAQLHQSALEANEAAFGPVHPEVASSLENLGNALASAGQVDEALEAQRRALDIKTKVHGDEHPSTASAHHNFANRLRGHDRAEEAERHHRRALAIWESAYGAENPAVGYALVGIGADLMDQGKHDEACEVLERAVAVRVAIAAKPGLVGQARFRLAKALWAADRDRPRALALARTARDTFAGLDSGPGRLAHTRAEAWLADRE